MNFGEQSLSELFKITEDNFLVCSGTKYKQLFNHPNAYNTFACIINTLGSLSAQSQALKQTITTMSKLAGTTQRIYIKVDTNQNKVLGFVKVGERKLFYRDYVGNIAEIEPTCVLDIYVHESCQRAGVGKDIFDKLLETEGHKPQRLAFDRPSPKLIGFLTKHYQLTHYIPQNNNYVIFDSYFSEQVEGRIQRGQVQRKQVENIIDATKPNVRTRSRQVSDSLQMFQKEIESRKNTHSKNIPFQPRSTHDAPYSLADISKSWAIRPQAIGYRTSSKAYGNSSF